jgi:hypothetical protein
MDKQILKDIDNGNLDAFIEALKYSRGDGVLMTLDEARAYCRTNTVEIIQNEEQEKIKEDKRRSKLSLQERMSEDRKIYMKKRKAAEEFAKWVISKKLPPEWDTEEAYETIIDQKLENSRILKINLPPSCRKEV